MSCHVYCKRAIYYDMRVSQMHPIEKHAVPYCSMKIFKLDQNTLQLKKTTQTNEKQKTNKQLT